MHEMLTNRYMGEANRAQNVCQTCALRKKACDKSLPSCGFCTKRDIFCNYGIQQRKQRPSRTYHPGRNFVAVSTYASSVASWNMLETTQGWTNPLLQFKTCASSQSFDEYAHQHACRILDAANLIPESIGQHYFRVFDRSLPIISLEQFHEVASKFGGSITPPPADYSIMLICMLLVSDVPGLKHRLRSHSLDRLSIYLTVKVLFSQAQAIVCTSLQLIQAAFLIAACEHLSGRPDVAYISVVSCIGMARSLEVGESPTGVSRTTAGQPGSQSAERMNVDWAIAVLER